MVVTFLVIAALLFVLLLTWGDTATAPRWVRRMNTAVTAFQTNLLTRFGSWRHQRRVAQTPGVMLGRHYMSGAVGAVAPRQRGSLVRVLSPVTDPAEQRMFFLWEVGFHTELDLQVSGVNTVQVTKKELRVLDSYCTLHTAQPGKAVEVFRRNGLALAVNR